MFSNTVLGQNREWPDFNPRTKEKQTPWNQTQQQWILRIMPKRIIKTARNHQPDLRETLAANIRQRRLAMGLSQEELAFRCALDRTYISAVERCIWNVSLGNIEKIADALEVEAWRLLVPLG